MPVRIKMRSLIIRGLGDDFDAPQKAGNAEKDFEKKGRKHPLRAKPRMPKSKEHEYVQAQDSPGDQTRCFG